MATSIGIIAGGVLGLLFSPEKGEETRQNISGISEKLLKKFNEQISKEKLSK